MVVPRRLRTQQERLLEAVLLLDDGPLREGLVSPATLHRARRVSKAWREVATAMLERLPLILAIGGSNFPVSTFFLEDVLKQTKCGNGVL